VVPSTPRGRTLPLLQLRVTSITRAR
jgi:hypothetical protein